ncbi:sugar ABC transporter substrate-binding protein [Amaricoccus sp.]|uniref:sugar ABC transporter substrate-binding protein n=1 Tax=Amaricoccus sp. TaxID=1872485 RepID=UPI00260789D8|nr:sugar ABC transporter substrate-binding protein [uncultured Amaricoccus sp.]
MQPVASKPSKPHDPDLARKSGHDAPFETARRKRHGGKGRTSTINTVRPAYFRRVEFCNRLQTGNPRVSNEGKQAFRGHGRASTLAKKQSQSARNLEENMLKHWKSLAFAAGIAAYALGTAAPSMAQDAPTIIVVSHGQANDPFWSVVKNGVDYAAKETGASVSYRAPETFDMVAMSQLIDAAVNQNPAGLVVSIPDADALAPSIERAVAAGIPVISMNSGADVSKQLGAMLHVGQAEFDAGKAAGEKLKEMGGKIALCVNQEVGNVSLDQRCAGFTEGFGGTVTVLPTTNDPTEVEAKVKAAIAANPSVDTIMALGASTAGEPSLAAVKATGAKINVATFDLSAGFLDAVAKGEAAFCVDQQQFLQGYLPVVFLNMYAKFGLMPGGNVPSGPNLITKEKAAQAVELSAKGIR